MVFGINRKWNRCWFGLLPWYGQEDLRFKERQSVDRDVVEDCLKEYIGAEDGKLYLYDILILFII